MAVGMASLLAVGVPARASRVRATMTRRISMCPATTPRMAGTPRPRTNESCETPFPETTNSTGTTPIHPRRHRHCPILTPGNIRDDIPATEATEAHLLPRTADITANVSPREAHPATAILSVWLRPVPIAKSIPIEKRLAIRIVPTGLGCTILRGRVLPTPSLPRE